MLVRRAAGVAGLVLGLCLSGPVAWAEEPVPTGSGCPTAPAEGGGEPVDGGEVTAEPAPSTEPVSPEPTEPVDESPVAEPPAPTGEPAPTEEPAPTGEPEPVATGEPGGDAVVCIYTAAEAVGATSGATESSATSGRGGAPELPRTGTASAVLLGLGLGLVIAGGGAVVAGSRRGRSTAA